MSNNQLPADPRKVWQYKENFYSTGCDDYDGHYEVTNGHISLCTTDDPEDITETENTLHMVVDALNHSGCKFYVNTLTENALFIENELLKAALEDIARQRTCAEVEADDEIPIGSDGKRIGDVEMGYDCCIETAREALKRLNEDRKQQWKEVKDKEAVTEQVYPDYCTCRYPSFNPMTDRCLICNRLTNSPK